MLLRTLSASVALATAFPALAAGPLTLTSDVRMEKRVAAADGTTRTTLVKADRAVPGDRVVFVLSYRNTGAQPLSDVVLANPVPKNMAYRAPALNSAAPELSVDGKTYGTLAALRVPAGTGGLRAAGPDDVTTVRWRLPSPIPAGSEGKLAFQAVLK
ncbi:hypothetical protein [Sphingomonas hylomeconis]|uniref:DUF11 domain-containing protein n=1 Tax=Sphingomonas hylomeconis TaxID=1395958 RepID=A0ABV7SQK6_9SPHN|nr:hypothetical protein [Sphingomonas hylomeconis]